MNDGKSKKQLNALLRKNASAALFPILRDLGIQAALTHKAALALHLNTRKAAKSPEILAVIAQHVQKLPGDKKRWIARGIDPSIFTLAPSQKTAGEGANDADDGEDDGSDSDASEGPPAVVRASNVAIQGQHYGCSAVTDIVAREVVSMLEELGFECAILGSAASHLFSHGETRVPEQLDVLILPPASFTEHQGWVKQQIFYRDPIQFEWNSKQGRLFFKFQPNIVLPSRFQGDPCDLRHRMDRQLTRRSVPHFIAFEVADMG
ncbi:hypothetical protein H1R20_g7789, partial [Candolleomyces eurysporus]